MGKGRFVYFQPNKLDVKDTHGDCAVRCICKAEGVDWLVAYDALCAVARKIQAMPNTKVGYELFLKERGYTYHKISNAKGSKRPTVDSFAKEHKEGIYVLVVANHYVCCADGKYYDIWDCGDKCLYGYWERTNFE